MTAPAPLPGWVPYPPEFAARYRQRGYWAGITLHQRFRQVAQRHPERIAVVCAQRRWSYAELDRRILRFAAGLARLGIGRQDRVVLQLPNIAEFYVACYALFRLGALPVFALPAHRRAEIGHFIGHTQARAAIIADQEAGFDHRGLMRALLAEHACLREVIVVGQAQEFLAFDEVAGAGEPHWGRPASDGPTSDGPTLDEPGLGQPDWHEPDSCKPDSHPPIPGEPKASAPDPGDPVTATLGPGPDAGEVAFLQLSGGSTGVPKLIPRTHDDYLYSVRESAAICGLDTDSVYLCALPAAHNFPLSSPGALGVFDAGGRVVLARQADPAACFALIEAEGVTQAALVPALALAWLESSAKHRYDLSSLRRLQIGGAHLPEAVARRVPATFGCRLQQVFGMAEGLVNYTRDDDPEDCVFASQGRPISEDDEIRIVDEDDREVAAGTVGNLLTRGPYTIRGYYHAQAHNARAFTADGFYRTGDRVRRLPSGHLVVEGRVKDLVNRGGEKIAAEEVEAHLMAHPAVLDAALVAMPDRWLGEKACAFVVLRAGAAVEARGLLRFLRDRGIAAYKLPDRIEWLPALPRTPVGKIDKQALRGRLARPAPAASAAAASAAGIAVHPDAFHSTTGPSS